MTDAYAQSGVDTHAGDLAVELMKKSIKATLSDKVVGGFGGFAGMFDVSFLKTYERPLLATSTDGVGTKVAIAQAIDKHDTIGQDLVGMVVDDIVVVGAKSMFMTDYIATGKVVPERIAEIVSGIAMACKEVGVSLIGGETAEHPGLLKPNEYDVAGAAVGAVEYSKLLGPHKVQVGDVVLGLESSGLHSNGISLVRKIVAESKLDYTKTVSEFGSLSLGEALLTPTRLYTGMLNELLEGDLGSSLKAMSHITGGGIAANIARVLPKNTTLDIQRTAWNPLDVFKVLTAWSGLDLKQVESTWNLGLGFVVIVKADKAAEVQTFLSRYVKTTLLGIVEANDCNLEGYIQGAKGVDGGAVRLTGNYNL